MPLNYATPSTSSAPQVEDGTYPATFKGADSEAHPDWATPKDRYGKPDTGDRIRWDFTVYDEGEPVDLNRRTRVGVFNPNSKTVPAGIAMLKALLTKSEFATFTQDLNAAGDDAEVLLTVINAALTAATGRDCQVVIENNDKEWPQIVSVIAKAK